MDRPPEERVLEEVTREFLLAYRDSCLDPDWAMPAYHWSRKGPDLVLTIGDGTVEGRLSGWVHLAGAFWALAAAPTLGIRYPRLIPNFTLSGTSRWGPVNEMEEALQRSAARAGLALVGLGEPAEATLCLRRFFSVAADRERLLASPDFAGLVAVCGPLCRETRALRYLVDVTGYQDRFRVFAAWVSDADPIERIEGLTQLDWWLMYHADEGRSLKINALVGDAIARNLADPEPWVQEAANACASRLGMLLWSDRAHPEALPWLEAVVSVGEGLAVNLLRLYETRLALEDPSGAAETWSRQEPLGRLWSRQLIDVSFFDQGSLADARAAALARVARDHLRRADDLDPCRQRRKRLHLESRQLLAHRQLAEALVDEALALLEGTLPKWLEAARSREVTSRRFSAGPFFLKGRLEEERGNLPEALRRYEQAQTAARSLAVAWRRDDFDGEVARLRARLRTSSLPP